MDRLHAALGDRSPDRLTMGDRAETLGRLQAGEITFAELLERAEADVVPGKTKISHAPRNVRDISVAKATRLMSSCEIAENRKLAGLRARQRQAVLKAPH